MRGDSIRRLPSVNRSAIFLTVVRWFRQEIRQSLASSQFFIFDNGQPLTQLGESSRRNISSTDASEQVSQERKLAQWPRLLPYSAELNISAVNYDGSSHFLKPNEPCSI